MSVHFVSIKGARQSNEDKHTIIINLNKSEKEKDINLNNVNLYGVYDGHGGKFVSNFLSENLPLFFTDKATKYPLTKNFVNEVYDEIQNILYTKYQEKCTDCGSTCLVCIHFLENGEHHLNVLNTGDSRGVICRNNMGIPLTKDHKPNWPDEKRRINKLGGEIKFDGHDWRILDLSVSRAFGDKSCEKYISHRPELFKYKLYDKDKFMILACDGLWDVISSQDAVNFILENCYDIDLDKRINENINVAKLLAEYALKSNSTDNVTVIVVFF